MSTTTKNTTARVQTSSEGILRIKKVLQCFLVSLGLPKDHIDNLEELHEFVVIGDAALFILGYRDDFDDIDLIVPRMWSHYSKTKHLGVTVDASGQYCLRRKDLTEEVILHAIVVHGLTVIAPEDILAQKKNLNREKDQDDIRALETNGIKFHSRHRAPKQSLKSGIRRVSRD